MKKIYIFEKNCCGPSATEDLIQFLQKKFGATSEVKLYDLGKSTGNLPIPSSLLFNIQALGTKCLPALVVNGIVLTEGWLPNFLDAVDLIEKGEPSKKPVPSISSPDKCC
jgi:ABC-type amino acid transport substrate-binding protein